MPRRRADIAKGKAKEGRGLGLRSFYSLVGPVFSCRLAVLQACYRCLTSPTRARDVTQYACRTEGPRTGLGIVLLVAAGSGACVREKREGLQLPARRAVRPRGCPRPHPVRSSDVSALAVALPSFWQLSLHSGLVIGPILAASPPPAANRSASPDPETPPSVTVNSQPLPSPILIPPGSGK